MSGSGQPSGTARTTSGRDGSRAALGVLTLGQCRVVLHGADEAPPVAQLAARLAHRLAIDCPFQG
jgi:hypothetical protein